MSLQNMLIKYSTTDEPVEFMPLHTVETHAIDVILSDGTTFHLIERYPGRLSIMADDVIAVLPGAANSIYLVSDKKRKYTE